MGLKTDLAICLDPALMMVKAGMNPDDWQKKILRQNDADHLLNCSRQSGKTTVIACKALHKSVYSPKSLSLILSPSERQSKLLLAAVQEIKDRLGVVGGMAQEDDDSTLHMDFANGSQIVALPGKEGNVRGFASVALIIIDEASLVPDSLYNAVRPMLSVSKGRICIMSTPRGKRGFFHKEWTEGDTWEKTRLTAAECPRISSAFLAVEQKRMPASWYRQEYFCEFVETDDMVFSYSDVQAAMSDEVRPLFASPRMEDEAVTPLFQ